MLGETCKEIYRSAIKPIICVSLAKSVTYETRVSATLADITSAQHSVGYVASLVESPALGIRHYWNFDLLKVIRYRTFQFTKSPASDRRVGTDPVFVIG